MGGVAPGEIKLVLVTVRKKVRINMYLIVNDYGDRAVGIWRLNPLEFCVCVCVGGWMDS